MTTQEEREMNVQEGVFWLILTVFLEAGNQSEIGQKNVAKVIINRANLKRWPISDVILARKQFSCYNNGLAEALVVVAKEPKEIVKITRNVQDAIDDWLEGDNLKGATHYFNPALVPGRWPASWDRKKMTVLFTEGDHIFLREG